MENFYLLTLHCLTVERLDSALGYHISISCCSCSTSSIIDTFSRDFNNKADSKLTAYYNYLIRARSHQQSTI